MGHVLGRAWHLKSESYDRIISALDSGQVAQPRKFSKELYVEFDEDYHETFYEELYSSLDCLNKAVEFSRHNFWGDKHRGIARLWAVKSLELLNACNFNLDTARKHAKRISEKEEETRVRELNTIPMDKVERKYFEGLLHAEGKIKHLFIQHGRAIDNPFPIDISNSVDWGAFLGYLLFKSFRTSSGELRYPSKREYGHIVEDRILKLFGAGGREHQKHLAFPSTITKVLEDCVDSEIFTKRRVPEGIKEGTADVKFAYLGAVYDVCGSVCGPAQTTYKSWKNPPYITLGSSNGTVVEEVRELVKSVGFKPTEVNRRKSRWVRLGKDEQDKLKHLFEKYSDLLEESGIRPEETDTFFSSLQIRENNIFRDYIDTLKQSVAESPRPVSSEEDLRLLEDIDSHVTRGDNSHYRFYIGGREQLTRFRDRIGFRVPQKSERLARIISVA